MGGEGSGKSFHGALYGLNFLADLTEPGHYMIIGDSYAECRPEFKYLVEFVTKLGLLKDKKLPDDKDEPCMLTTRLNQEFYTYSAKDPAKVSTSGVTPKGIIVCEVGRLQAEAWGRVLGRAMRVPCWLWASGSFEYSTGWLTEFWKMGQEVNAVHLKSWSVPTYSNVHLYSGRDDPKLAIGRLGYDTVKWSERIEGKPMPAEGLVYQDFRYTTHVREEATYHKGWPVYLAVDPGYQVYAVLACQIDEERNIVYVFDELYDTGMTTEGVIGALKLKPWWNSVTGGAIDIASTQHHSDRSAEEVWSEKAAFRLDYQKCYVEDEIERVMTFLQVDPKRGEPSLFVSPRCKGLIAEMGGGLSPITGRPTFYQHTRNQDGTWSNQPAPKNNHACTALAYFLISKFGFVTRATSAPANYLEGRDSLFDIAFPKVTYLE